MSNEQLPTSPDWATAPERATHFAIDSDGSGNWYGGEPEILSVSEDAAWDILLSKGCWPCPGKFDATNWQNSLQKRPE